MERLTELRTEIARLVKQGVCLAFSGGVDSALLLALAAEAQRSGGGEIQAVTFSTRLHPQSDIDNARRIAGEAGVPLHVIEIDEFSDPEIVRNPPDRCYRCKKHLFSRLKEFAGALHLPVVMDGTKTLIRKNLAFNWGNRITLRVLPPVPALEVAATETHELMQTVRERMCEALAEIRK